MKARYPNHKTTMDSCFNFSTILIFLLKCCAGKNQTKSKKIDESKI